MWTAAVVGLIWLNNTGSFKCENDLLSVLCSSRHSQTNLHLASRLNFCCQRFLRSFQTRVFIRSHFILHFNSCSAQSFLHECNVLQALAFQSQRWSRFMRPQIQPFYVCFVFFKTFHGKFSSTTEPLQRCSRSRTAAGRVMYSSKMHV